IGSESLIDHDAAGAIDDADDRSAFAAEVVGSSRSHIPPALHDHAFVPQFAAIDVVIMAHAFGHPPAGDHVGHGIFPRLRHELQIVHHLAYACAQLFDRLQLSFLIGG